MGCTASTGDGGHTPVRLFMQEIKHSKRSDVKKSQVVPIHDHSTSLSVDDRFGRSSVASLDVASISRSICDMFTMTDARKKVRVSIAALSRDVHKSSRALLDGDIPTSTHSMLNPARKTRRMSSVDGESSSLRKDLSLGRGKLLAKLPAPLPCDINAMSLKTLLSDPTLGKAFARFAVHRGGFASESCTRLGSYRPSLFLRNDVIVNNGKTASAATIAPHEVEVVAFFLADVHRLRSLESAWESCAKSRRSSDVELRAASGTLRDLEWNGETVDGGKGLSFAAPSASALQSAAFAQSMGRWYFGVRGLLAKIVPVDCHPEAHPKVARAFSKAEQFVLTGVSQKLLQDFKKAVSLHNEGQEAPHDFADKKTVVVIGAGVCGLAVCHELSAAADTFQVILIDKKDYFEFTPMVVRQLNGISARSDLPVNVPLQQVLHNTEFVCGKVTSVTPHTVEVNYQKIPFDYLVVASGARARSMLKPQCVSAAHRVGSISAQAQSASVSSLLVVGSGPSAVEYAAVAKSARPSLDVTLCCDATRLLPRIKDGQAVHDEVLSRLTDLGVHVRLHTRLVGSGNNEGTFAVANSSERVTADKIVWCTGTIPNTAFLRPTFSHILDPIGRVKVVRSMQVAGYKHVFAGGDVCMRYTFEEKAISTALSHAAVIAKNIHRVEKGMKPVDHQEVRGLFEAVVDFGAKPGLKITGSVFETDDTIAFKARLFESTVSTWSKPKSFPDGCSLQDPDTNSMSLELDIDEASK